MIEIGNERLTIEKFLAVVRHGEPVSISQEAIEAMAASEKWVSAIMEDMRSGKDVAAIYSINTGFGSLAGRQAFDQVEDASELSRRLILSNASGVGRHLDEEVVRGSMLVRAVSLTRGHSAVRRVVPVRLYLPMAAGRLR